MPAGDLQLKIECFFSAERKPGRKRRRKNGNAGRSRKPPRPEKELKAEALARAEKAIAIQAELDLSKQKEVRATTSDVRVHKRLSEAIDEWFGMTEAARGATSKGKWVESLPSLSSLSLSLPSLSSLCSLSSLSLTAFSMFDLTLTTFSLFSPFSLFSLRSLFFCSLSHCLLYLHSHSQANGLSHTRKLPACRRLAHAVASTRTQRGGGCSRRRGSPAAGGATRTCLRWIAKQFKTQLRRLTSGMKVCQRSSASRWCKPSARS